MSSLKHRRQLLFLTFFHLTKTTPWQISNENVWPWKLLPMKVTKDIFSLNANCHCNIFTKKLNSLCVLLRKSILSKMTSTKTYKNKNGHHFLRLTFKVIQLFCLAQKDSFTPKVLKLHFVSVKNGSASIWYVAHSTFDIEAESCLTVTNCNFRTFRVKESFWAKQQSCITLKVSLRKWCPFFVFVCFSGCHFT